MHTKTDERDSSQHLENKSKARRLWIVLVSVIVIVGIFVLMHLVRSPASPAASDTSTELLTMNATIYRNAIDMIKAGGVTNPAYLKSPGSYSIDYPETPESIDYSNTGEDPWNTVAPVSNQQLWVEDVLGPGIVLVSYLGTSTLEFRTIQIPCVSEYSNIEDYKKPISCEAQSAINSLRDNLVHKWIAVTQTRCHGGSDAKVNKSCLPPYSVMSPRNQFNDSVLSNIPDLSASDLVDVSGLIIGNGWGVPPSKTATEQRGEPTLLYDWSAYTISDAQLQTYQKALVAAQREHLGVFRDCSNETSGGLH